jgi:hypothetical protein
MSEKHRKTLEPTNYELPGYQDWGSWNGQRKTSFFNCSKSRSVFARFFWALPDLQVLVQQNLAWQVIPIVTMASAQMPNSEDLPSGNLLHSYW